jgi:hypothetical protein
VPKNAPREEMLTTLPPPRSIICGTIALSRKTAQVHGLDRVPAAGGDLEQRGQLSDPGAVHEDVPPLAVRQRRLRGSLGSLQRREVLGDDPAVAPLALETSACPTKGSE